MTESSSETLYVTNTFTLKNPADAERVIGLIKAGVERTSSKNPGYVSDVVYRSIDGKTVLNASTWRGGVPQLMANHAANEKNPDYAAAMAEIARYADMVPAPPYETAFRHGAAAGQGEITSADVHRWLDAWNSHELPRILALFSDDVVMHQPQNPRPLDKGGLEAFFAMLFTSYDDIHFELQGHTIQGRDVASWERVTGTMTGAFHDPSTGQTIAPTGKKFDILGAMHLVYGEQRLIREVRIYWDRLLMMQQVGLLKV
jgi:steroid delta-isomerase-like uncharacterized protein